MNKPSLAIAIALALGACNNNQTQGTCDDNNPCPAGLQCIGGVCLLPPDGGADLGGGGDLAVAPADLSVVAGGKYQYATSAIKLPGSGASFAFDADGSGKKKNQLKSIVQTIAVAGFDLQGTVDKAVLAGDVIQLLEVHAKDLKDADPVSCSIVPAASGTMPSFDGSDHFTPAKGAIAANLQGRISAGQLGTTPPPKLTQATVQKLGFQLPLLGAALPLTLYGVQVVGAIDKNGMMNGEVHGVVRKKDVDSEIIPAIAAAITLEIHADPNGMATKQLIGLFETGDVSKMKCDANMADCCATNPKTCKILPEEVAGNFLIQSVLKPDVQMFDNGGSYIPVADGANPDSLTVGLGFTGVKASF